MALTGTLSNDTAARRVKDTASFFVASTLPGALERFGPGFKSAAMVRLMHSMVRFNVLQRSDMWDVKTFGIPIPQVDQMPAGLIAIIPAGVQDHRQGTASNTPRSSGRAWSWRAIVASCSGCRKSLRRRQPREIVDMMVRYDQTLRKGFDDATCGELTRATLAAYLPADKSLGSRIFDRIERRFSKIFFLQAFLGGDISEGRSDGRENHRGRLGDVCCVRRVHRRAEGDFTGLRAGCPALRRLRTACWCGSWSACWRAMGMLRTRRMRRRIGRPS